MAIKLSDKLISGAVNNILAGTENIYDSTESKFQSVINSELRADLAEDIANLAANYYTNLQVYTKSEVDSIVNAIKQFEYIVITKAAFDELTPSNETMHKVYLVEESGGQGEDHYDEFITVDRGEDFVGGPRYTWENIGNTRIDLSNYYTKSEVDGFVSDLDDSKVDKVDGYSLMSTNEHTKLEGVESGAQVNVHANWNESDPTEDAYIQNKPTTMPNPQSISIKKNSVTLNTYDGSQAVDINITVPTKTSDLTNDDYVVKDQNYSHIDNNYTTAEKNKLAGIESGAEVNVQVDWAQTTTTADSYILNKPTTMPNPSAFIIKKNGATIGTYTGSSEVTADIIVPTKNSDLTNDDYTVHDSSYVHTDNNYTSAEQTKLAGIATGAEVNVQADWNEANSLSDAYIQNKPQSLKNPYSLQLQRNGSNLGSYDGNEYKSINITVPTKATDLTDDITYELEEDGNNTLIFKLVKVTGGVRTYVGDTINIPQIAMVMDATRGTVTAADKQAGGIFFGNVEFSIGDVYLDFTCNTTEQGIVHLYINVSTILSGAVEDRITNETSAINASIMSLVNAYGSRLPDLAEQPCILFGDGTPQESIVPINWRQYNKDTGEGYNWNGLPSMLGQQYINISGGTNGRYIAVPDGEYTLKWQNC